MISKNMPDLTWHTKLRPFLNDQDVPMWMKLFHLFIVVDAQCAVPKKGGWTIWRQNPNLIATMSLYDEETRQPIWSPSLSSVQKSIAKLEEMGFIKRVINPLTNQRFIKLNRARVIEFLRQNSLDTDIYEALPARSRERKLIRRKILTVADYINARRNAQNEQFKRYLNWQSKKYGYDITVPDVDIFDINIDETALLTREEVQMMLEAKEKERIIDNLYARMRTF